MKMENEKFTLTATDFNAINLQDSSYINNKGANQYVGANYAASVEYYHLAAAMGNVNAISNLGYCYLYGREIEPNLSLAIAYFKVAAARGDVDASYKLGDIYGSDKWGVKDKEMSVYYYRMAASFIIGTEWENSNDIIWNIELLKYPSLCFAMGRELLEGGAMKKDLDSAYQFLKKAETGYVRELTNGNMMYEKAYSGVLKLLEDPQFDEIREKYNAHDEEDEDEDMLTD